LVISIDYNSIKTYNEKSIAEKKICIIFATGKGNKTKIKE
jgi:hypothetical protein